MTFTFELPLRLVSTLNVREFWAKRAKRTKLHRQAGRLGMLPFVGLVMPPSASHPMRVTLSRVAPRPLDSDNLAASFKALRDGIADALRVDDGSPWVQWCYGQRKGKPKEYAVTVDVVSWRTGE